MSLIRLLLLLLMLVGCGPNASGPITPPPSPSPVHTYTAKLTWDPVVPDVTQSMIARYGIYRADMSMNYTKGMLYSWVTPDLVTFDDIFTSPDKNFTKYYVVTAIDVRDQESGFSNEVSKLFIP